MAKNKDAENNLDESFDEQVRQDAVASENSELQTADHVVNHEPQAARGEEVERRSRVRTTGNRTLQGMPSDVHAALVALSNLHRNEAAAFEEVSKVLQKYEDEKAMDELNPDVVAHLQEYRSTLAPKHELYHKTRKRLEENV